MTGVLSSTELLILRAVADKHIVADPAAPNGFAVFGAPADLVFATRLADLVNDGFLHAPDAGLLELTSTGVAALPAGVS